MLNSPHGKDVQSPYTIANLIPQQFSTYAHDKNTEQQHSSSSSNVPEILKVTGLSSYNTKSPKNKLGCSKRPLEQSVPSLENSNHPYKNVSTCIAGVRSEQRYSSTHS